jgi:hypothetical protein
MHKIDLLKHALQNLTAQCKIIKKAGFVLRVIILSCRNGTFITFIKRLRAGTRTPIFVHQMALLAVQIHIVNFHQNRQASLFYNAHPVGA